MRSTRMDSTKNNMKDHIRFALIVLLLGMLAPSSAGSSEFESWKRQQQAEARQQVDEFEAYRRRIRAAFKQYKQKTSAVWGRKNVTPGKRNWISYIDNLEQRSVVDFDRGTVDIAVAVPQDHSKDDAQARKKLEKTILSALALGADTRSIEKLASDPVSHPGGEPLLQGQIADRSGKAVNPGQYRKLASELSTNASRSSTVGKDGRRRVIYQTRLRLVPDHIRRRAIKYQPMVERYAATHKIPVPVVFAVMETESMFNPMARSPAPAFGLMQLVPTSGARDAYRMLFKQDKIVSDTYLYQPDKNIQLGTAYLNKIYYEYMKGIESDQSRILATIAAYNTGSGNVFKAFVGRFNRARFGNYHNYRKAALREINRRTPDEVYRYMRRNLPFEETRTYIKKVSERIPKYIDA